MTTAEARRIVERASRGERVDANTLGAAVERLTRGGLSQEVASLRSMSSPIGGVR